MPKFSIVTPVYNPPLWALECCIDSVLEQTCEDWEWVLVNDASTDVSVIERLDRLAACDSRIRVFHRSANGGIVKASNDSLAYCTGEYVALLDHDDSLTVDALSTVRSLISLCPDADYIYSDEDKIAKDGTLFDLFSKPDWAPDRLLGQNYCCHLSVIRRALVEEVGGFREGFEGSQDYDLVLRVTEKATGIYHIPKVLYHWRVVEGSTAGSLEAKPYAVEAARKAVSEHLARRGIDAEVRTTSSGYQQVVRKLTRRPLVSIIIPSGAFSKTVRGTDTLLVGLAIQSIVEKSTYDNYEVVLVLDVNENRKDPRLAPILGHPKVKTVDFTGEFDFSAKCNLGAVRSSGEVLLFLNDDTEVISRDWLETLLGHLEDPGVGIVGARLLFENGTIQSAGHTNDPSPHSYGLKAAADSPGEFGNLAIAQERSGVTGACLAIPKALYFEVGGMSEDYPHCFNDVDLCFKVLEQKRRIIWTPFADLYHFESLSRDPTPRDEEIEAIYQRWGRLFGQDRYLPQPTKFDWRD